MDLLSKFNAVEVAADTRISEPDRKFCDVKQEAYRHQRKAYREIIDLVKKSVEERQRILRKQDPECNIEDFGCLDVSKIEESLRDTHEDFIGTLVYHFASKYRVTLDSDEIKCVLVPKRPDRGYYSFNKEEWQAYLDAMDALELTYQQVLDQIFIQLGGASFKDKAVMELKEKAHKGAWNSYHGNKCYEQKKAVISFTSYACHFDTWYTNPHVTLTDGMKNVIKAAAHFETGTTEYMPWGFTELCGYSFERSEFEFTSLEKIKGVKCFKNGRVDIRFTSEAFARQFVEEYLGMEA